MEQLKISSIYNHHKSKGISFEDSPSMTKQEFVKECDINNIISKYHKTGVMDNAKSSEQYYQDVSEYPSFEEAIQYTLTAKESFMGLDPNLRKRFNNDPQRLLNFLEDPKNKKEGQELGLLKQNAPPKVKADPTEVIITENQLKSAKEPTDSKKNKN